MKQHTIIYLGGTHSQERPLIPFLLQKCPQAGAMLSYRYIRDRTDEKDELETIVKRDRLFRAVK